MKIGEKALLGIKENVRLKNRLALELNCSVFTVSRYIKDNSRDLTTAGALKVIREETGLTDKQILVAEEVAKA